MKYYSFLPLIFLSICSACVSPKVTQSLTEDKTLADLDQISLVNSYSRLLNAFFIEPKCRLMTNEEFGKFYMYTEVSTAALVKYNVISASAMDTNVKRGIEASANQGCDSKAANDIEFAKVNAEHVAKQIKLGLGKDNQWTGEGIYTLHNAIARVTYESVMGAWYIENKCKFLTSSQNKTWQEQTAGLTKQYLDQKYMKEDEVKKTQQDAYALVKNYNCDEVSKSIVNKAYRDSALSTMSIK